jgi:predicted ester cyclase
MPTAGDLVRRQHELLKCRDVTGVPELYAPGGTFWMAGASVSPDRLPALMRAYLSAFPDIENEITGWIQGPGVVVVEQVVRGTHLGTWVTPFGELHATGKRLRWESVEIVRAVDGKITSWRSHVDQLGVLAALGLLPEGGIPDGPYPPTAPGPPA